MVLTAGSVEARVGTRKFDEGIVIWSGYTKQGTDCPGPKDSLAKEAENDKFPPFPWQ